MVQKSHRDELEDIVKTLTDGYCPTHGWEHAEKVAKNALQILSGMKDELADLYSKIEVEKVVESAAWFHDVLDHKMISDPEVYKQKEEALNNFLAEHHNTEFEAKLVMDICNNVSYSKEVKGLKKHLEEYEVLRDIVSDADKLESIGELGVIRCYQYNSNVHKGIPKEEVLKDVRQHCEDKLLRIQPGFIRTGPGKKLGAPLHQDLVHFYNGLTNIDQLMERHS